MEQLCNLLFEVSNEDRLRILHLLQQNRMNVTQLSHSLDLSSQEASRHMSRLNKIGVTRKDVDGKYYLTLYGTVILKANMDIEFIKIYGSEAKKTGLANHTLISNLKYINLVNIY